MATLHHPADMAMPFDDERAPILVTTVDLGDGNSGTISLLDGDDPQDAAHRFCVTHGLPLDVVEPLTLHILENLESLEMAEDDGLELSQAEDVHAVQASPCPMDDYILEAESPLPGPQPHIIAAADDAALLLGPVAFPSKQPLVRPSSALSSVGSEYYGRPLPSTSSARSAEAAAAPAPDRLYADHFRKQRMLEEQRRIRDLEMQLATRQAHCTPASRALAAHRTSTGYGTYFERLYAEGRLEAMRRETEAERLRAEDAEAELAEATFRPQISRLARGLQAAAARIPGGGAATAWDRLYAHGWTSKKERRTEVIRRELTEQEMKECSFQPKVDARSAALVRQRRGPAAGERPPLHERLYNEGVHSRSRQQLEAAAWLPEEATFRPRINTSSVVVRDLLARQDRAAGASDVSERLLMRGKQYRERLEAARRASAAPVDDEGRPLFRPRTNGRLPKSGASSDSNEGENAAFEAARATLGVGERLYTAAVASSARAAAHKQEALRQAETKASAVHISVQSSRMIDRLKRERLAAIYAYLAGAGPGRAPPHEINLLRVVRDEIFMDTIDPEVRADVEHAGRLLMRTLARRNAAAANANTTAVNGSVSGGMDAGAAPTVDTSDEWAAASVAGSEASPFLRSQITCEREAAWACSKFGEVTEAGFIALMLEALHRTRGIARQYLLPLPSARKKWDDPTFKPEITARSQQLAARSRPADIPAHELLYRTAQQTAERLEVAKAQQTAIALRECRFKPQLIATQLASQGRALKLAAQAPKPRAAPPPKEEDPDELAFADDVTRRVVEMKRRRNMAKSGAAASGAAAVAAAVAPSGRKTTADPKEVVIKQQAVPLPEAAAVAEPLEEEEEEPLASYSAAAAAAASPATSTTSESLHYGIDAIERQIKEAMARLSLTGEEFAAILEKEDLDDVILGCAPIPGQGSTMRNAHAASTTAGVADLRASADVTAVMTVPPPSAQELAARLRASLEYDALFGEDAAESSLGLGGGKLDGGGGAVLASMKEAAAALQGVNPLFAEQRDVVSDDKVVVAAAEEEEEECERPAAAVVPTAADVVPGPALTLQALAVAPLECWSES